MYTGLNCSLIECLFLYKTSLLADAENLDSDKPHTTGFWTGLVDGWDPDVGFGKVSLVLLKEQLVCSLKFVSHASITSSTTFGYLTITKETKFWPSSWKLIKNMLAKTVHSNYGVDKQIMCMFSCLSFQDLHLKEDLLGQRTTHFSNLISHIHHHKLKDTNDHNH